MTNVGKVPKMILFNVGKVLNRNTVVLVDGVRQAGKSFAIRAFGKDHFGDNYFEFNFHDHEDVVPDFNKCKTASELITNLSYYSPRPFVPGKTLIFLDEIQLVDGIDWEMFSKYLVMDGRFRLSCGEKQSYSPFGYL
jgi:predicted AAA+ superfamily ATPase